MHSNSALQSDALHLAIVERLQGLVDHPVVLDLQATRGGVMMDSISRVIGRLGENLVTNFLLAHGFHVTHLDKGVRGVSANADLLAIHEKPTKLSSGIQQQLFVQVKTADARQKKGKSQQDSWVRLGNPEEGKPFYNKKPGIKADVVTLVSWRSPNEQRIFFIPVEQAEKLAKRRLDRQMAEPRKRGEGPKKLPVGGIYLELTPSRHPDRRDEIERLLEFEDGKSFGWNAWQ